MVTLKNTSITAGAIALGYIIVRAFASKSINPFGKKFWGATQEQKLEKAVRRADKTQKRADEVQKRADEAHEKTKVLKVNNMETKKEPANA
jgi:ADP-ribosylglycohydrolase